MLSADPQLKLGRNEQCRCGSGRKYKKCCGQQPSQPAMASDRSEEQVLRELMQLLQAGRYVELETAAQGRLGELAQSGATWKLLAAARFRQGKDAFEALMHAADGLPADAEAQCNFGNALRRRGRFSDAAARHLSALAIDPRYAPAHNDLGAVRVELGQIPEAIASYRKAIELKPDLLPAHVNLGRALLQIGEPKEAARSFRRALRLDDALATANDGLAAALMADGQPHEALVSYQRVLELEPESALANWNLGNALVELGRTDEALAAYHRAVVLQPTFARAHSNLGCALRDVGRLEEAAASLGRALELAPQQFEIHNNLSIVLRLMQRFEASNRHAARAHELEPERAAPLISLARLQADAGDFAAAEALLQRALALEPDCAEACSNLAGLRRMTPSDAPWLAEARRIVAVASRPQQAHLHFAIGKYFDDVADFDQAFRHYQLGNELKGKRSGGYERAGIHAFVDRVMQSFLEPGSDPQPDTGIPDPQPVFIVGMPRSGTSLAEQILASHPALHGGGERVFWGRALSAWLSVASDGAPEAERLESVRAQYRDAMGSVAPEGRRLIDKMPVNFQALGLIHATWPKARFIHMQRDPLDTCLSIFFQDFESSYQYANDLEDLAHYYGEYSRLMAHWRAQLPAHTLLDVPYEALVADPALWSRRMVEFLGIDWDPACLNFHRSRRPVITASKWQVRQPISQRSVGRWRNYQQHLGPLLRLQLNT